MGGARDDHHRWTEQAGCATGHAKQSTADDLTDSTGWLFHSRPITSKPKSTNESCTDLATIAPLLSTHRYDITNPTIHRWELLGSKALATFQEASVERLVC